MAKIIRGDSDTEVEAFKKALDAFEAQHPGAEATLYRHSPASIRLRVIDRRFEKMAKSSRHAEVWDFLAERLPEDALADVSIVLAITPSEMSNSFANFDFEQPLVSRA